MEAPLVLCRDVYSYKPPWRTHTVTFEGETRHMVLHFMFHIRVISFRYGSPAGHGLGLLRPALSVVSDERAGRFPTISVKKYLICGLR